MLSRNLKRGSWCGGVMLGCCVSAATALAASDGSFAIDAGARAACASLPSAEHLDADIAAFGASAVLRERLWPDQRVFEALLNEIETGSPAWLGIAAALRTASDAGATEGLSGALTSALAKQPENVLRLLAPASAFTVAEVCSARFAFIEQPAAERRWRRDARQAVAAERDEGLATVRDACLAALPSQ